MLQKSVFFDTRPNVSQSVTFFETTEGALVQLTGRDQMYTAASIWLQVYHQNPQSDILYLITPPPPSHAHIR